MTQKFVTTCDRCGEQTDHPEKDHPYHPIWRTVEVYELGKPGNDRFDAVSQRDLCPTCTSGFARWFSQGAAKERHILDFEGNPVKENA